MSRLEEIKAKVDADFKMTKGFVHVLDESEYENMNFGIAYKDVDWLINRVEELEYASKYNGELNEFLQKRKLPPNTLGRHVVDVVMDYVEELEQEREQDPRQGMLEDMHMENEIYKQALEEITKLPQTNRVLYIRQIAKKALEDNK